MTNATDRKVMLQNEEIDSYWGVPISVVKAAAEKGTMVKFLDPFGLEYSTAEIERMESE